ncbi:hypothetical protein SASPL_157363 [Salvia splendens]|uniref:glucan endo-1,3-beta-D-glucosidase n=1 Tax=Salvia splendens TaxID=180675 RepID=A0A8X8VV81_SALSN|nr:hypothetical protein SASPL_157363 [Salvia splendens]
MGSAFLFATLQLLTLFGVCRGGKIGICYGRNADDLPTPDKAVQLIKLHNIKYVRIYDSNIQVLKTFANTGIELMIGIPNADLLAFSQFQSNADTWLKNSILPYYPATKITYITVGAEVTEAPSNISAMVVPAMQNVLTSLKKAGLHKKIKVSSTHSLGVLSRSFPPSAGAFSSKFALFLNRCWNFLLRISLPLCVNIYPYYAYRDSSSNVFDYALFESSSEVIDPNTGLLYTNMFDAQIDAINFALMALNFNYQIMVTETGWLKGSKDCCHSQSNAQTYNTNLIRHLINDTGTPAKGGEIDTYIFSLFNENRKPGLESERNWGLFFPDQTSVYNLDFTGKTNASEPDLRNGLDWACGNVDCSAIQESALRSSLITWYLMLLMPSTVTTSRMGLQISLAVLAEQESETRPEPEPTKCVRKNDTSWDPLAKASSFIIMRKQSLNAAPWLLGDGFIRVATSFVLVSWLLAKKFVSRMVSQGRSIILLYHNFQGILSLL